MTEPERLQRRLDSLRVPPLVEEVAIDGSRKPVEQLEGADRPIRGQELTCPAANFVVGIGLMALDIGNKVRRLFAAIVDGKGADVLDIGARGVRRRMFETNGALEAKIPRAWKTLRSRRDCQKRLERNAGSRALG